MVVPSAVQIMVLPAIRSPDASAVFLVVVTEFCVLFPNHLHHVSEMTKLKSAAVGRETKIYKCKNLLVPGPYLGCPSSYRGGSQAHQCSLVHIAS